MHSLTQDDQHAVLVHADLRHQVFNVGPSFFLFACLSEERRRAQVREEGGSSQRLEEGEAEELPSGEYNEAFAQGCLLVFCARLQIVVDLRESRALQVALENPHGVRRQYALDW